MILSMWLGVQRGVLFDACSGYGMTKRFTTDQCITSHIAHRNHILILLLPKKLAIICGITGSELRIQASGVRLRSRSLAFNRFESAGIYEDSIAYKSTDTFVKSIMMLVLHRSNNKTRNKNLAGLVI